MTFTSYKNLISIYHLDEEDYITHASPSNKTGRVVSEETIRIIDETESRDSLQIIFEDGEPANTGHICKFIDLLKNHGFC